jgi:aminopeptidase N
VSNGAELEAIAPAADRKRIVFAPTRPLSTYLFAFAAGRFQTETAERRGRTFHMLHRETDAAKLARNRDVVFDLHDAALRWLEDYTGIPYPFDKFDFVMIPSFQFSGMEHPGSILYNASSMLLDESATENQLLNRASTISHETAHMWFGDLVTMRWFDDVWMKEVFANFMAAKIVNPSFPTINHDLRFLAAHYPAAYGVDRTQGTHPIRQPLDNLSNAGSQYGAIIYQKAPIVMRQLELLVGEVPFRDGLRDYLTQLLVRQCDVAGSRRHSRRSLGARPGGVEPRLGGGAGSAGHRRSGQRHCGRPRQRSRSAADGPRRAWPRVAAARRRLARMA